MPIRTASLANQIHQNGTRLHLAMVTRIRSQGPSQPASEAEQVLLEERRSLKAAQAALKAKPRAPKPKAAWMTRPVKAPAAPKPPKAPKAPKAAQAPKDAKGGKDNKPTRAEKLTKKAENLDAAKRAASKSAKT